MAWLTDTLPSQWLAKSTEPRTMRWFGAPTRSAHPPSGSRSRTECASWCQAAFLSVISGACVAVMAWMSR